MSNGPRRIKRVRSRLKPKVDDPRARSMLTQAAHVARTWSEHAADGSTLGERGLPLHLQLLLQRRSFLWRYRSDPTQPAPLDPRYDRSHLGFGELRRPVPCDGGRSDAEELGDVAAKRRPRQGPRRSANGGLTGGGGVRRRRWHDPRRPVCLGGRRRRRPVPMESAWCRGRRQGVPAGRTSAARPRQRECCAATLQRLSAQPWYLAPVGSERWWCPVQPQRGASRVP